MDYRNDTTDNLPVGLRNNNPGDIKDDGTAWQGKVGTSGVWVTFADTTWGLRAVAVDLKTKITKDGLNTISLIVNKYAPTSDNNDVPSYIAAVSSDTGIGPDDPLTADDATLQALVRAVVNHELGGSVSDQYISDADIAQGVSMISSVSATVEAAGIAAQQNPLVAIAIAAAAVWLLAGLFSDK